MYETTNLFAIRRNPATLYDVIERITEGGQRGREVLQLSKKSILEMRERIPDLILGTFEEYRALKEAQICTNWREISQSEYLDALCVVPPIRFHSKNGVESFFLGEMLSGAIGYLYASYKNHYFTAVKPTSFSNFHSEIIAKVDFALEVYK